MVATVIRSQIEELDDYYASFSLENEEMEQTPYLTEDGMAFYLGSKQKPLSLETLESSHNSNLLFSRFRIELGHFMYSRFMTNHQNLNKIQFKPSDSVSENLKVICIYKIE